MGNTRVKISSIIENQLPDFVKEEFPLVEEFLSTYYLSSEYQSGSLDILQNIDQYVKIDNLTKLTNSTKTTSAVSLTDNFINVVSTQGFPNSYGLIKIGNEIITYTSKTSTTFNDCVRGFSGVTSYDNPSRKDHLLFSTSEISEHTNESEVTNLSILFLKEFFIKIKKQFAPGFEDRELYSELNQNLFIKQSRDFYSSKGTDKSFKILFRALYGDNVEVIKPRDYVLIPSNAQYRISKDLVVEAIEGNPEDILNRTLFQDETSINEKAFGSVSNVEKIFRGDKEYYVISLDYKFNEIETNTGEFTIHPNTKVIASVSIGSSVIDVDSTIGFPNSGNLIVDLDNGTSITINYKSKSYTQFYDCSDISQNIPAGQDIRFDSYAYSYSGIGTSKVVKLRVTGVLSDVNLNPNTKLFSEGNKIQIKTLGRYSEDIVANNWIFNVSTRYQIESAVLIDNQNFTYQIKTYDDNDFYIGDKVSIFLTNGAKINSTIISVSNSKFFNISGQGEIDVTKTDWIHRERAKANFLNFPEVNVYEANVQNVYDDKLGTYLVTSSSLPNYFNSQLQTKNKSASFSGTFYNDTNINIGQHDFLTGDSVVYQPKSSENSLDLVEGIYFVKKVDSSTIKLARSRENLYKNIYISVSGTVTDNKIILSDLANKYLQSQKLVRTFKRVEDVSDTNETKIGTIGILANGVEVLNYKSKDTVFYGPIEKINVLSEGKDYDVVSPPVLSISDSVGTGVSAYCEVEGSFENIIIVDGGFDYLATPTVTISGGNGKGAVAEAELLPFQHTISFDSTESAGLVNLSNNTIGFSTYHKFRDSEGIVYVTKGQQSIGGLSTESTYYAFVENSTTIKLHKTYGDALAGINTIDLTSYGVGIQAFSSTIVKKKVGSIKILNSGSGYRNRKISIFESGISTSSNTIFAPDHRYKTGEVIKYSTTGQEVEGLSSGSSYYVTVIDQDNFKLSKVGTSSTVGVGSAVVGIVTTQDFYFKTKQYVNLKTRGSGTHNFNYEPITVKVEGVSGISTRGGQNFNAIVEPIVRGEIKSVFIETGGFGYGSEEILNFNRQPSITLKSGKDAQLLPIVSNGKISQVIVIKGGTEYNSLPSLEILGNGSGVKLTPVISNGEISRVEVIDGGQGFTTSTTFVNVIPSGTGAALQTIPKRWRINLVQKSLSNNMISEDDGIIHPAVSSKYGLSYTHAYAPRYLRRILGRTVSINDTENFTVDLRLDRGVEVLSNTHSPIIGWAYDGNPIYGPYGYTSSTGGSIKPLQSGYTLSIKSGRPNISTYPEGFFVEDYEYTNSGDLDEFNGRFGITPEYPQGTYAYFATIDVNNVEPLGAFRNYRKPIFPYLIGNKFKSKPIVDNFSLDSNQDDQDLNKKNKFFRNTRPYNLQGSRSGYYFLTQPEKIKSQNSIVKKTSVGSVSFIGITSSGKDYRIGDKVIFDNTGTGGQGASFEVSRLKGKSINQVSSSTTSIANVEFYPTNYLERGLFVGFSSSPHNLIDLDLISISGISTFGSGLNGTYTVGVRSDTFVLVSAANSISTTGIVTYFEISGSLKYPYIRENDILGIGTEKVKVLNIEPELSRIRVLRGYEGTVGSSHSLSSVLTQKSRKFYFRTGIITSAYSSILNRELYFNPADSVGLGTLSGIGIGHTLIFSNPGFGRTSLFIPTRSIFIPNHDLGTGDSLIYSNNGGTPISVSTDGSSSFTLTDNQIVYAVVTASNLIGIATNPIGVGSTGNYVGINSAVFSDILYFTGIGTGNYHSFKTNYESVISGKLTKNLVTVSVASSHGLLRNDRVSVSCLPKLNKTYIIKYNPYYRRLVVNPKEFLSSDVNVNDDTITIASHDYTTGQKVIHTSNSLTGGLDNNAIYFIVVIDDNKIKLAKNYYETTLSEPNCINLTSTGSGTLSLVNPKIEVFKNQTVIFDLSDSSLRYLINSVPFSSFNFNLYSDSKLKNIFESSSFSNSFEVAKYGTVGVTTDAKVTLFVSDYIPKTLYYGLTPIYKNNNPAENIEIINDSEDILENNKIIVKDSVYSGNHVISGITSTTFSYNTEIKPEASSYTSSQSELSYTTRSIFTKGGIDEFKLLSGGNQYKYIPRVVSVASSEGKNALVFPISNSIGKIVATEIEDIGFEYSADKTLRPTIKLPYVIKVDTLLSFERIGITSVGKNYTSAPNLVVIDSTKNEIIDDIDLSYNLGDSFVSIKRNTAKLTNNIPKIIPINNSNGIGINSITFNNSTKDVVVSLATTYSSSSDYPFAVGDEVLIEGTSVGIGTTLRGYNSSSYGYSLFTLTAINVNIGGYPSVTYNLSEHLSSNETPGVFVNQNLSAKIVPKKFFPIFVSNLRYNGFFDKEEVKSENSIGIIDKWDGISNTLKIFSDDIFNVGSIIKGSTSYTHATILSVEKYDADYSIDSNSIVKKGFQTQSGFLNNDYQKIHDSDYYQFFSYSIKSKIDYDKWDDVVTSQNHTLGFKKFGDLKIESGVDSFTGLSTAQDFGEFESIAFTPEVVGFNHINDFDFAKEKTITVDSETLSNELIFQNTESSNYTQVLTNRVLTIDNISNQFNSEERLIKSASVDTFKRNSNRSKKYIIDVFDRRFSSEKQISLVTILHDSYNAHINQYARVETIRDLGSFDVSFSGDDANLLFYPNQYQTNNFSINYISYNLENVASGISTLFLGDIAEIKTSNGSISANNTNQNDIVSIASSYRASKILIQISANNNTFNEYNEISVIHNGVDIEFLEYGKFGNNATSSSSSGLGTYGAYFSGSNLNISFTPNVGFNTSCTVNSIVYSLTNNSTPDYLNVSTNRLKSSYVSIASTPTPGENVICEYDKTDFNSAYYIVSISDVSNNRYQMSEVVVASTNIDSNVLEFGKIYTDSSLGEVSTKMVGDKVQLCFIPIQNTQLEARVFENILGVGITNPNNSIIDLSSGSIEYGTGIYNSTSSEIRREFDLFYKQLPIFQRTFEGNNPNIVNITENTIKLPNHFFVTGERVSYSYEGEIARPIEISETSFVGIGVTNKLHSEVYVVKINDSTIKLASTAQNALKEVPEVLNITSVGIGSNHKLTATNQNSKSLITIDNVIQSPVVATAVTSSLSSQVLISSDVINLSGITSIFGGDLLKIDDEIVKVRSVGFGQTNSILVDRAWMGTGISTHSQNSLVTKLFGSYNITNNKINFINPPYGQTPIPTSSSNETDWTGITTHSTFSGRIFLRSGFKNSANEAYSTNYILDDISNSFNGIKTDFILKSNKNNLSGIVTSNGILLINQIAQSPQRLTIPNTIIGDYLLEESAGITTITFTGSTPTSSYDINSSNVPKGGIIVSVASTGGFGYQPLVSAGGTAIVSAAGTISSISIGNSGSGYRAGIQTFINVGVYTSSTGIPNIQFIGTAAVSNGRIVSVAVTNPGVGYTSSNPPKVIFDAPLPYSNIPLIYSQSSSPGFGTGAKVDIVVGNGSSVINFDIKNFGYGYGQGETLTIDIGGIAGIPTDTSLTFSEFSLEIDKTTSDTFSGLFFGDLQIFDPLDDLFDGNRTLFPLTYNETSVSIKSRLGSLIDVQATLLVFINDILQVPNNSYIFDGGSTILFTEAPKPGDTCRIIFYQGTSSVDIANVTPTQKIKVGDFVRITNDSLDLSQNDRLITKINSVDSVSTNNYPGPGISKNQSLTRIVNLYRQTEDLFIDNKAFTKDRIINEPLIQPSTNIIQNISIGSTEIYVESVKTFFDSKKEYLVAQEPQNKIIIVSNDTSVSASATAIISSAGIVSSILITDGGFGYDQTNPPKIIIQNPIGFGSEYSAKATTNVSIAGTISSINIDFVGFGYTTASSPVILIEPPTPKSEVIDNVNYSGDFGAVVGYGKTMIGLTKYKIFDFHIPNDSVLRDADIVGTAVTISQIEIGDYFTIQNSNVSLSSETYTNYRNDGSIIGVSTQYIDGIYQVSNTQNITLEIVGIGTTSIKRIFTKSSDNSTIGISSIGFNSSAITFDSTSYTFDYFDTSSLDPYDTIYYGGDFTWGKISNLNRIFATEFNSYGISGISTSASVLRFNPLKYNDYN